MPTIGSINITGDVANRGGNHLKNAHTYADASALPSHQMSAQGYLDASITFINAKGVTLEIRDEKYDVLFEDVFDTKYLSLIDDKDALKALSTLQIKTTTPQSIITSADKEALSNLIKPYFLSTEFGQTNDRGIPIPPETDQSDIIDFHPEAALAFMALAKAAVKDYPAPLSRDVSYQL